jgi:predicted nucleic acid-binding protein
MTVLFDTNVILDLLLEREPFVDAAEKLMAKVERGEIVGMLGATTVTTLHYLLAKNLDKKEAERVITTLLRLFEIAAVTRIVLEEALKTRSDDYEDAVLCQAAYHAGADLIVTRDRKGFEKAGIPVATPNELLAMLT